MKKLFLIFVFILLTSNSFAQLYEGGVFIGGSNYIGDVGPTTYINPNAIAVGLVGKFNYSPRITFRGTLTYTNLSISNERINRPISLSGTNYQFANKIFDGALGIEFSFFKYSLSKTGFTQTPYIIAQIGAVNYRANTDADATTITSTRTTSLVLPFGVGYKMKLAENIGISFETTVRYTFKDNIDGNNHDLGVSNPRLTFGNPNSDDWYVFTGISIVYAFGRPGCYTGVF